MNSAMVSAAIESNVASIGYLISAVVGLVYLAILVWVLARVWRADGLSTSASAAWLAAVFFVPVVGMLGWFVFGERGARRPA